MTDDTGSQRAGDLIRCNHCYKLNNLMLVECEWRWLTNTMTKLPDVGNPTWKCKHCGCWQDEE